MLVAGKTRLVTVTGLLLVGFIAIVTLSYNPSYTEQSAQYLKKWTQNHNSQGLLGSQSPVPPQNQPGQTAQKQEAIPYNPAPQTDSELPSTNPNPFAAVDQVQPPEEHKPRPPTTPQEPNLDAKPEKVQVHEQEKPTTTSDTATSTKAGLLETETPGQFFVGHDGHVHPSILPEKLSEKWHQIKSLSMPDGHYFEVNFYVNDSTRAINPNILPHPHLNKTWIAIAQKFDRDRPYASGWSEELVCNAEFDAGGNLSCIIDTRGTLTVPATSSKDCNGSLTNLNLNIGPHDARALYGPDYPYLIYGTQSKFTCFGQFVQDLRLLLDWGVYRAKERGADVFQVPTEIQRPPPYGELEKNYYFFWDLNNVMYVHQDTAPQRVFTTIDADGSVGPDLSEHARPSDTFCWKKHQDLNPLPPKHETSASIHQASNSLSITMCKRHTCTPDASNTFVMEIYQHKIGNGMMHARYEPYVMLFRRQAPFEMYSISAKPIWLTGRRSINEMLYVTSISWKEPGMRYHGYLDDVMFVSFGVEDQSTASMDLTAEDLIGPETNMMMCDTPRSPPM